MNKTVLSYNGLIKMEQNLNRYTTDLLAKCLQLMSEDELKLLHGYEIEDYRKIDEINSKEIVIRYSDGDTYKSTLGYLTQFEKSELIGYILENTQLNI